MDKQIKEEIAAMRAFYARRRADRAEHTFGWPVIRGGALAKAQGASQ